MNPAKLKKILSKIENSIREIESETGVKIYFEVLKNTGLVYKTILCVREDSEKENYVYESICRKIGFTQNVIGMKFQGKNGIYEITEIKPNNRKYPVIAKSPTGESYKYSVSFIKKLIGGDNVINRNANLEKLIND
mgnify:CR=1 FL=1